MLAHETFQWFNSLTITTLNNIYTRQINQLLSLCKIHHIQPLFIYDTSHNTAIITIKHPQADQFMKKLKQKGGSATFRNGYIRLSVGLFHTLTSYERLFT